MWQFVCPLCTVHLGHLQFGAIVDTTAVNSLVLDSGSTRVHTYLGMEMLGRRVCRCSVLNLDIAKKICKVVVPIETCSDCSV